MEAPKCILLRGDPIYGEGAATTTVMPGMLVVQAGGPRTVSAQPTVTPAPAGEVSKTFSRENEVMGGGVNDPYLEDDNVLTMTLRTGDHAYAWLAPEAEVVAGQLLSAAGGGAFAPVDAGDGAADPVEFPSTPIARALESVDNSGEAVALARLKVEVL